MSEEKKPFEIETDLQLNWAIEKYKEHLEAREGYQKQLDETLDRLNEEYVKRSQEASESATKLLNEELDSMNYLKSLAQQYLDKQGKKQIKTVSGKAIYKKKTNYYYADNLLSNLKNNGLENLINLKVTESVDKNAVRAWVKENGGLVNPDGEIIDGFKAEETEEFEVKI